MKPQNKGKGPVIIISGPPGSGTTTIAREIARHFGLDYFSTGDIFRKVAKERGLEVSKLSKVAEQEVDWEVDNKSKQRRDRDRDRYMERYQYNVDDVLIYDLKIDAERLSVQEVVEKVAEF